jgi:hypothetical protein
MMGYRDLTAVAVAVFALLVTSAAWLTDAPAPPPAGIARDTLPEIGQQLASAAPDRFDRWLDRLTDDQ